MVVKHSKEMRPKVEIDNPKTQAANRKDKDLSDHFPIIITVPELKIVSYNIQLMPALISDVEGKKTSDDITQAVSEITDYFAKQGAGVCCVQELFDNKANELMGKKMRERGYIAANRVGNSSVSFFNGGVRTFVKQDQAPGGLTTCEYIYKNKIDYFIRADALVNKGLNHTCFNTANGTKYHIFNTHLQAYYPNRNHYAEVTLAQCVELKKFIETQRIKGIIEPDDKVVICGDFNIPKPNTDEKTNGLYEKMRRILGPRFTFLDNTLASGKPIHTISQTNTYNDESPKKVGGMNITVDMGILFDPVSVHSNPVESELSDIYCGFQLALSHYIRKNATIFTKWLLPKDKKIKLKAFDDHVKKLMDWADNMRKNNKNPLDDETWFSTALNLLGGPQKSGVKTAASNNESDIELQQTALLPVSNSKIQDWEQHKKRIDTLLYNLKQLCAQVHKDYIESPDKYKALFETSLKLHHVLLNAWVHFLKNPTPESFLTFQDSCTRKLNAASKKFSIYWGIWGKKDPVLKVLKGIIGLLVGILTCPVLLMGKSSIYNNYKKTFFRTPETETLAAIKKVFESEELSCSRKY